jgi:uncharacterized protein YbjT (DUF2867 family)
MKVVVFGATGPTGKQVVQQLLEGGHEVTAFVRSLDTLAQGDDPIPDVEQVRQVSGDIFDPTAVRGVMKGQQAVICALGSKSLAATTVRSEGTANIIEAMEMENVRRLLVVSAMGVGDVWPTLSWFNRLFFATLLHSSRRDHEAQEAAVTKSGLDWTIFRPSGLSDGPLTGDYSIGERIQGETSRIARADVAHAMVRS